MRSFVFLVAIGCAHHIEPVVRARVAPPDPSETAVTACWVEYARSGAFTASGIVVRQPAGVVLIDAGQSLRFKDEIRDLPSGRFYLRLVPAKLVPDDPASAVLLGAKVDPADIVAFVPTHAHSDHLGGLMDLPDLPVKMHPSELALLQQVLAGGEGFNVIPAEARRIAPTVMPLTFVDRPVEVFPRSADLLGNGTVEVIPLEGHTPGSVGVLIDTGAMRIFAAGDAINTRSQLDRLRGKSLLLRRTDADPQAADPQVAVLASLHQADPTLVILPAHERRAWVELFGEPGACIGNL